MRLIILLIILIPAIEIWGLITVGGWIGGFNTFLLIILTGILGAILAKQQGLQVLQDANRRMRYGEAPGPAILNGIAVLLGGIMLIVPGFFSDIFGILLLLPPTRKIFMYFLLEWIKKKIASGTIYINGRKW